MSRRPHSLVQSWPADSPEATAALTPRDDVVTERLIEHGVDHRPHAFEQVEGPFTEYHRSVRSTDNSVEQTTVYRLHIPWFGWLFERPIRSSLRHRRPSGSRPPWWAPPDKLSPAQVATLGLLAAASLAAAFINTVFTQTANFAADDFGISSSGQGLGGVVVRLGIVIAIPFAVLADRKGRRKMIVITAWLAPLFTALGAIAPTFWVLVATQAVGRPLSIALALLVGVVVAEEMPRNSRTYALSVLALAGGMGAGVAVASLPLADMGSGGWRFIYLIALVWLLAAAHLARSLPETRRFELPHRTSPPLHRRRFTTVAFIAVSANLFVAPASFFQNRYLDDVRGFSASSIALFTLSTGTPASLGLVLGGRLADTVGRRVVLITCMPLATSLVVMSFNVSGPLMWLSALFGGLMGGLAYPAFAVYRTELFPTGNRARASGWITAISLVGSSVGLVLAGRLIDHGWSYGRVMLALAGAQVLAAIVAFTAYPESAHMELEELNPEDDAIVTGLAASSP